MNSVRVHAAVHLGDGFVSVAVGTDDVVRQHQFDTALTMRAGVLAFLRPADEGRTRADEEDLSASEIERFPWAYIDDDEIVIGSTPVPIEQVVGGTIGDALAWSGAVAPVDLLEVICPSSWGVHRQTVVRRAAAALAREVVVIDAASAAVRSLGERAPSFAVVVEVGEFASTVSSLSLPSPGPAPDRPASAYERAVRWDAVGAVDLRADDLGGGGGDSGARASIAQRVSACAATGSGRGPIDVVVLATSLTTLPTDILGDNSYRVREVSGSDIVRSAAVGIGLSEPAGVRDPNPAASPSDLFLPPPRTARAAAWLDEVASTPPSERPTAMLAVGAAVAVVLAVVLGVVAIRAVSDSPTPVAIPARSSQTPSPPVPRSEPDSSIPTTTATATTTSATTPTEPAPRTTRFTFGRASVEVPASWSERVEPGRVLLVPVDLPERRIVVTSVELRPGTTFDEVANDLEGQLASRGEGSSFGSYTRATDFGGRTGISYVESPGDFSVVHWRIFVDDDLQVSIGCQSAEGDEPTLAGDCDLAVASLAVADIG